MINKLNHNPCIASHPIHQNIYSHPHKYIFFLQIFNQLCKGILYLFQEPLYLIFMKLKYHRIYTIYHNHLCQPFLNSQHTRKLNRIHDMAHKLDQSPKFHKVQQTSHSIVCISIPKHQQ